MKHAKPHTRFWPRWLLTLGLAALLLPGCSGLHREGPVYERDGVKYGVTKGTFRSRWWNYYERGCSYLDGGYYQEAEADFRAALQGRSKDQRWPRTYGLHFIPEYFPNRELGIALYYQEQVEESIGSLETSLDQGFTARAAFYVAEARRTWLEDTGKDATPPTIEITAPGGNKIVGALETTVEGVVRDDTFVEAITVEGRPFDLRLCAAEAPFSLTVPLRPGQNTITVESKDLTGKTTVAKLRLVSDVDGPLVSFDAPVVLPGTLRGVVFDPAGIDSFTINGKPAALAPAPDDTVAFSIALTMDEMTPPLMFECADGLGNRTRGTPPLDMLVLNPQAQELVFASGMDPVVPLGGGLYALVLNGTNVAVAAAPSRGAGTAVEMSNIEEGRQYFMDEIVVALNVRSDSPIKDLILNGETVPTIPGRTTLRTSRRIRLEQGDNTLTARAVDEQGAEAEDQKTVRREATELEMNKNKLSITFLPDIDQDAEYILAALAATTPVDERFTVVDRGNLFEEALGELELSEWLASKENKLELGKLIPAELMIAPRIRRDQESITIWLEGIDTETAVRILPQVDVAGPYAELDRLIEELGVRLVQELPRAEGRVLRWDRPEITTDLNKGQGVRDYLKCIIFSTEDLLHPDTGELLGKIPHLLCEGLINNVTSNFSTAEARPLEEGQGLETLDIQQGHYVVIK